MCFCTLGNILCVGAEGTVQGGEVGAVGAVVQKYLRAFVTIGRGGCRHRPKVLVLQREIVYFRCQSSVQVWK